MRPEHHTLTYTLETETPLGEGVALILRVPVTIYPGTPASRYSPAESACVEAGVPALESVLFEQRRLHLSPADVAAYERFVAAWTDLPGVDEKLNRWAQEQLADRAESAAWHGPAAVCCGG